MGEMALPIQRDFVGVRDGSQEAVGSRTVRLYPAAITMSA
jgi:hypothetical protein